MQTTTIFEPFKTTIPYNRSDGRGTYISRVERLLNFPNEEGLIDTNGARADIYFTLEPEITEWGLEDIVIDIQKVKLTFEWCVDFEELTEAEKAALLSAGGTEMRNDTIEGQVNDMVIENNKEGWKFLWEDCKFSKRGSFDIDCIEIWAATSPLMPKVTFITF